MCNTPSGRLTAVVNGGEGPFTYDWYTVEQSVDDPYCLDCGEVIENLDQGSYKVVVTDATSDQATSTYILRPVNNETLAAFWDYSVRTFPYIEGGEQPYLLVRPNFMDYYGSSSGLEEPFDLVEVEVTDAIWQEVGPWTDQWWQRWEWFRPTALSGTVTITYHYDGQQCVLQAPYFLPQTAAVLPDLAVVDVEGSCANAPTGSATIMVNNGTFPTTVYMIDPAVDSGQIGYYVRLDGSFNYTNTYVTSTTNHFVVDELAPGTHTVFLTAVGQYGNPTSVNLPYDCLTSIEVTIPNLGPTCGQLKGRVFVDNNLNCAIQANEAGAPGVVLEVQPGPYYASTGIGGNYWLVLPNGSYTVEAQSTVVEEHCSGAPLPLTITGSASGTTVDHPSVSLVSFDGQISLSSGPARPGFEYQVGMSASNLTPSVSGAITIALEFDDALDFLSATPAPSNVSGNLLTWSQAQLTAFESRSFTIQLQVPPDVGLLGTDLITTATFTSVQPDATPQNNSYTLARTVTGSYDPNDKLAKTSTGSTEFWDPSADEWIDYTIRFQNTGTDTAFHVIITDTLPQGLDPATLQVGAGSHPFTWELKGIGVLKFRFLGILLPDSNINEPRSHGFVGFRIKVRDGYMLNPGDEVVNIANIYFDFNPPVITEPSVLNVVSPIRLDARAWLGGAYDALATQMRDDLRTQSLIPLVEPYTALGYVHSGAGGGETIAPALLNITGPTAIVDWVLLELRSTATPATVLHSRAALLRRDGRITDKDGTSPVAFAAPVGSYRIALLHRNHLGVLSAAPIALGSSATTWDLRTTATALFGTTPTSVTGSTRLLWPGDGNGNGVVKYTGSGNDRDLVLTGIGGAVPTNVVSGVYSPLDINLDGQLRYTGANNDRDVILQTIGGTVPTAVRTQQVP
jgi:uncharacterized repeat protein (TIGR01451 family)